MFAAVQDINFVLVTWLAISWGLQLETVPARLALLRIPQGHCCLAFHVGSDVYFVNQCLCGWRLNWQTCFLPRYLLPLTPVTICSQASLPLNNPRNWGIFFALSQEFKAHMVQRSSVGQATCKDKPPDSLDLLNAFTCTQITVVGTGMKIAQTPTTRAFWPIVQRCGAHPFNPAR
jgi:hypothetical protein